MRVLILHQQQEMDAAARRRRKREAVQLGAFGVEAHVEEIGAEASGTPAVLTGIGLSRQTVRPDGVYARVKELCARYSPDVVHVAGHWRGFCLSAHLAGRESGAATVQEWEDFQPLCAGGWFLRPSGKPCQECLEKGAWHGAVHRCSGLGLIPSAALARVLDHHRRTGAWRKDVDAYLVASRQMKEIYARAGFPQEKIHVQPWWIEDPGPNWKRPSESQDFLCVDTLVDRDWVEAVLIAWGTGPAPADGRLLIAGDGPAREGLMKQARELGLDESTVVFLRGLEREEVRQLMRDARACLVPGLRQTGGMWSVGEAFANGRAVIVARSAVQAEWVEDGVNGFTVPAGDAESMADAVSLLAGDGELANRMGADARETYLNGHAGKAAEAVVAVYRSVTQPLRKGIATARAAAAAGGR